MLVAITGRYDLIRQRLRDGSINSNIANSDFFRINTLPPLTEIATYTIITAPRRDPSSMGLNRSVCTNINTNSAPVMANTYNDSFGVGPRRVQIYYYSISTPYCTVITVKPSWRDQCIADNNGSATLCYESVLANWDVHAEDREIRLMVENDFGDKGVPFMRCLGRPLEPMDFQADLLAYQTYWSGGAYYVSIQTSDCIAKPLVRSSDLKYTLFESTGVDEGNNNLKLLPPGGWFAQLVSAFYGVVTIGMIVRGMILALFHSRMVQYVPNGVRYDKDLRWVRYVMPFMPLAAQFNPNKRVVIKFQGHLLAAANLWMNHWLYMSMSILAMLTNLRLTYVTLQVGSFMLGNKITLSSYLYMCNAISRMTWILCLLQTMVRYGMKLFVRLLRSIHLISHDRREQFEWNIDGASMFITYKLYVVLLCTLLYTLLILKGSPSFMVKAVPFKVGVYGGMPDIPTIWGSEIMCDFVSLMGILLVVGQVIGFSLLRTKYKHVANNSLMRLLQRRYMICGWDSLMAADMLGLDVTDPDLMDDDKAYTKVSIGTLLQLLYLSGPSGYVDLAGDYIFHDGGLSQDPIKFRYPLAAAIEMGLGQKARHGSVMSQGVETTTESSTTTIRRIPVAASKSRDRTASNSPSFPIKYSIFDRKLRIASEGNWGKLILVDNANPGRSVFNTKTGLSEFEVTDALASISIMDIKWLLGNEKKIRIE